MDCAVIHGENLRQFLGGEGAALGTAAGAHGGGGNGGSGANGSIGAGETGRSSSRRDSFGGGADGGGAVGGSTGSGPGVHAWWLESFAVSKDASRTTIYLVAHVGVR